VGTLHLVLVVMNFECCQSADRKQNCDQMLNKYVKQEVMASKLGLRS